jgi:predicted transcriptional regulator
MSNNRKLGLINRSRVLNLLKSNPNHSYSVLEASKILDINTSSVRMHFYALENINQVVCTQNNHRKRTKQKRFQALTIGHLLLITYIVPEWGLLITYYLNLCPLPPTYS